MGRDHIAQQISTFVETSGGQEVLERTKNVLDDHIGFVFGFWLGSFVSHYRLHAREDWSSLMNRRRFVELTRLR